MDPWLIGAMEARKVGFFLEISSWRESQQTAVQNSCLDKILTLELLGRDAEVGNWCKPNPQCLRLEAEGRAAVCPVHVSHRAWPVTPGSALPSVT